ncbi:MAG: hypothetical protein PHE67_07905 [Campylobacterales bacterium]|nr:hypothetical protein [Campylobacterales bacterium]
MHTTLNFNSLLVIKEQKQEYSFFTFKNGLNIIHGKNTSGKTTLIQMLLYTLGINDVRVGLTDIWTEDTIFRLDCSLNGEHYIFVRESYNFYIKHSGTINRFHGINADSSEEHKKLKDYLNGLFNFHLNLESNGTFSIAPLEVMYLPYYVSQDMGWISLRASFRNLQYYKNFKADYLDYYLGIENVESRVEKRKLEEEKLSLGKELAFYGDFELKNSELKVSKFADEEFMEYAKKYLDEYTQGQEKLKKLQNKLIEKSNALSYYKTKKQILEKVKRNQLKQNPEDGVCPVCENRLKPSQENIYRYHQNINDTFMQLHELNEQNKDLQGEIDSIYKKIEDTKVELNNKYKVVQEYQREEISFKKWITNKTNMEINRNLDSKKEQTQKALSEVIEKLKGYQTDDEIKNKRIRKDQEFEKIFKGYLSELGVNNKHMLESKYLTLYNSFQFPTQGVENHKVFLAFNFAFNKMIEKTVYIHRAPFLLDAIFNEDIEDDNRKLIVGFIEKHLPTDTQTFITVADSEHQKWSIMDHTSNGHFINIGDNKRERALLEDNNFSIIQPLYDEIQEIIEKV